MRDSSRAHRPTPPRRPCNVRTACSAVRHGAFAIAQTHGRALAITLLRRIVLCGPQRKIFMKSSSSPRLLAMAAIAGIASTGAIAQQPGANAYFGLSAGQSNTQFDAGRIATGALPAGVLAGPLSEDKRGQAYKLFGGYPLGRNLGVEAGYFNLGTAGVSATTVPPGSFEGRFKAQGLNLDLVGTLPISESWSAIGRVGAQYARTTSDFNSSGAAAPAPGQRTTSGTNPKIGAGLQYALGTAMLIRAEVERYRISDSVGGRSNVDVASVSLVFPIGQSVQPRPLAVVPEPAPVMAAAPPAPTPAPEVVYVPVVTPPVEAPPAAAPAPARVSFSAESLFDFDRSVLGAAGRAALDTFARDLAGTRYETIKVEGHTDRIGSAAYNQKLSTERADIVKAYLVNSGQIDAARISSSGLGETMPVTRAGDCKGEGASASLITCLQPDRRVDIEVWGTR